MSSLLRIHRVTTPSCSRVRTRGFTKMARSLLNRFELAVESENESAVDVWKRVTAVCFDVDSTVCPDEGIDVLAEHCGAGDSVKAWTTKAMEGNVRFEDSLSARLSIIQPSKDAIRNCLSKDPPKLSPGVAELISTLHNNKIEVFLVSGGFRMMIEPVAKQLKIPSRNIFANTIFFDDDGKYAGFDESELTSRTGGKAAAVKLIKKTHGHSALAMVGDGITDLEARPPADLFVGYGGVVSRRIVKEKADWYVTDFRQLTQAIIEKQMP